MKGRLLLTVFLVLLSILQVYCIRIINHFIDEQENALTWKELKGDKIKDESEWYEDFEKRAKNPDYGASDAEKQYFIDAQKRPKYHPYKLKDDTTPFENKFRKVIANETKAFENTHCYDSHHELHFSDTEAAPRCNYGFSPEFAKNIKKGDGKKKSKEMTVNDDDDKDNEKE